MKMTRLEKQLVNRPGKARRNIARLDERLQSLADCAIEDVLELGCGSGEVSGHLSQSHGFNVTAADVDPEQIELARRHNPIHSRLRFSVEDATDLSFADRAFDLVVAQNLFHHLPAWRHAAGEIHRVLRPGGHLIWFDLATPGVIRGLMARRSRSSGVFTLDEVAECFAAVGFRESFRERVRHGPLSHYHLVLRRPTEAGVQ